MSLSIAWTAFALSWLLMVPVLAGAQSTIAGEARDATGAVLPGVTVEAASDALIEKIRTATTGRSGTYWIGLPAWVDGRVEPRGPAPAVSAGLGHRWLGPQR